MLEGMSGMHGVVMPYRWLDKIGGVGIWLDAQGVEFRHSSTFSGEKQCAVIFLGLLIAWCFPNSQQIMARFQPGLDMPLVEKDKEKYWQWYPSGIWMFIGIVAAIVSILTLTEVSTFIYFQF